MKFFLSGLLSIIFLTQSIFVFAASDNIQWSTKFIVTAYYSPLPNQNYYLRGSYEADVVLNGNGTNGASGKEVFIGMLAAPKKYAFGTKIQLKWLGIGVVHDRGGAIVPSGERNNSYDRIDVWMGSGEEGLRRALQWGRRTVEWEILPDDATDEDGELRVTQIPLAPKSSIASLKVEKSEVAESMFEVALSKESSSEYIKNVQEALKDLEYYSGEVDGKYGKKTIDAIYDFQVKQELVKNEFEFGSGFFGKKTRETLEKEYSVFLKKAEKEKKGKEQLIFEQEKSNKEKLEKNQQTIKDIESLSDMKLGDIGQDIRTLQKILAKLGRLKEKDTAIYGEKTRQAIIEFQIKEQIIDSTGAGNVGPETRKALEKLLIQ